MDLRTGQPVWLASDADDFDFPRLTENLDCDVVIVGAGVTAALALHQLLQAGLRVVVIERRAVARGSTAASTGLLLYQTDTSLEELARFHSPRAAARVYRLGRRAIRELGSIVHALNIDCGFEKKDSVYVASDLVGRRELQREVRRAHRIHLPGTLLSAKKLKERFGFDRPAGLAATGCAQVNAFRLTRGIFDHYRKHKNLHVFQHTTVSKISEQEGGVAVRTNRGFRVKGRFAIVAAGYEAGRFVKNRLVRLHSTYVIASARFPEHPLWPKEALLWETARPYFYLRLTDDRRIVFGGQDESFADEKKRDRLLKKKTADLESQFAELFPQLAFKAEFAWTGTFAETVDGLPCIGPANKNSKVLFALGYGGNGITFSQIAARIICDRCRGKANPDAALFRLNRKIARPSKKR